MKIKKSELRQLIREAMTRITEDEMAAWKNGDWGYVAGDEKPQMDDHMDMGMDMGNEDPERFLHGEDPSDEEGAMVKSRLYSMKEMAKDICEILNSEDQLPGWVQDHVSVAHENLQQIHGYLMGQQHAMEHGHEQKMEAPVMESSKKTISESHNRVTREEMDAWMRGDWGFISEADEMSKSGHDEMYFTPGERAADYEECSVCGFDHEYEPAAALAAHKEMGKDFKVEA